MAARGVHAHPDDHRPALGRAAADATHLLRVRRRLRVVASNGGTDEPPAWYVNLREDPGVHVQVLDDRFPATARTADADEKARLWPMMAGIWPAYDDYQRKTEREIPVVVLEPAP